MELKRLAANMKRAHRVWRPTGKDPLMRASIHTLSFLTMRGRKMLSPHEEVPVPKTKLALNRADNLRALRFDILVDQPNKLGRGCEPRLKLAQ